MGNCFSFCTSEPEERSFDRNRTRTRTRHSQQTHNDNSYYIDGQLKSSVSRNSRAKNAVRNKPPPPYKPQYRRDVKDVKINFKPDSIFQLFFDKDFDIQPVTLDEVLYSVIYTSIATLNRASHFDYFTFLLKLEECEINRQLSAFNLDNVQFSKKNDSFLVFLNDSSKDYWKLEGNTQLRCYDIENVDEWYFGQVEYFNGKNMAIKFYNDQKKIGMVDESDRFGIRFFDPHTTIQLEHRALGLIRQNKVVNLLFPTSETVRPFKERRCDAQNWKFFNIKIEKNLEQSTAIKNIVNKTTYPLPYIIYGPPGTGKTTTVVEAILQVFNTQPGSNILVVSATNSACDTLASYLLEYDTIIHGEILRVYGRMAAKKSEELAANLREISNLENGQYREYKVPCLEDLCKFTIVVLTMELCGKILMGKASNRRFSYIFIDECGSVRETTALIPMSLSATSLNFNAQIVLAGDPKQLGPVIQSELGKDLGFGCSYLERLMRLDIYEKSPDTMKYDVKLITKLKKNYRSHPALLTLPNRLFYNGDMEACTEIGIVEELRHTKCNILVNKKFPLLFRSVFGYTQIENDSPSSFNMNEVDQVKYYLDLISQALANQHPETVKYLNDIGIITPYRKQAMKLKVACEVYTDLKIEIGTIEQFQ